MFKTGWFKTDPSWHQPALSSDWDALCSIRDAFHDVIQPTKCNQYDVVIGTEDEQLCRILQVGYILFCSISRFCSVRSCSVLFLVLFFSSSLFCSELFCICDMIKGNESDVANIDFEL